MVGQPVDSVPLCLTYHRDSDLHTEYVNERAIITVTHSKNDEKDFYISDEYQRVGRART